MVDIRGLAELLIVWRVNSGSCDFWYDNWVGSGALHLRAPVLVDVGFQQVLLHRGWNGKLLASVLPLDVVHTILEMEVLETTNPDVMIWSPSTLGEFSLGSAYQEVREVRESSFMSSRVRHSQIPLRVSFFMLRLLRGRLPLDDALTRFQLHLPLKCVCCASPKCETVDHLFADGDMARTVWRFFGSECSVRHPGPLLRGVLAEWWFKSAPTENLCFILWLLPVFICWHLWKVRNSSVFQGVKVEVHGVCCAIFQDLKDAYVIKYGELQEIRQWPQFLGQVELRRAVIQITKV
ncbi:uncharacterized protein [Coffea arabica]|uniref:Reverse transcriptase zinc-binding domain-containing protein n=1 Tax=Coffea arabica TaxID=13443 RepID=A0ABM4VQA8_COFAR